MSVNVSLVDTPGVSVYFDGQPIQDLQEAELQREEERQAKELQQMLERELEDFEDDFLSGSNSEDDDTGNASQMSGQLGVSQTEGTVATPRKGNLLPKITQNQLAMSPLSKSRGMSQSIPEGLNMSTDPSSPFRLMENPKARAVITEDRHDGAGPHGLSMSVDSLVHAGLTAEGGMERQGFEHRPSAGSAAHPHGRSDMIDFQGGRDVRQIRADQRHFNASEFRHRDQNSPTPSDSSAKSAHLQKRGPNCDYQGSYDGSQSNLQSSPPQSSRLREGSSGKTGNEREKETAEEEDQSVFDLYRDLPHCGQNQGDSTQNRIPPRRGGNVDEEQYAFTPFGNTDSGTIPEASSEDVGYGFGYPTPQLGNPAMYKNPRQGIVPSTSTPAHNFDDEEWMMQIQTPGTAFTPIYSHYPSQERHVSLQTAQYQQQWQKWEATFQHRQDYVPYSTQSSTDPRTAPLHPSMNTQLGIQHNQSHLPFSTQTPIDAHLASQHAEMSAQSGTHTHPESVGTVSNQRQQHFQVVRSNTDSPPPPPLPSSSPPTLPSSTTASRPKAAAMAKSAESLSELKKQEAARKRQEAEDEEGQFNKYKVHYKKNDPPKGEEEFYLQDEDIQFFTKDGPDQQRTYEQLEILYRARGREIEELNRKLEEKEENMGKEMRILKHKLAIATGEAEGTNESLKQCQKLLQQSKSDNADASGKIRSLETQVSSLKDSKEELIKKLQTAETTIENLSHHIEELQDSESLSRARNDHESMISSLTQRYDKELLGVKEKLDACKAALESKQEELVYFKKQLADTTHELEQAQISRGETINRLAKSLEDSQRQCQALLEHSSSHEISTLKVQLQQCQASKRISEDLCRTFQNEVKELKEQMSMFETASSLGAFTTASSTATHNAPSHDDSMTDLGIRKTLDFDTPQSIGKFDGTQSSDDLITSLRSELEKCLRSNKQKRSEVAEKAEEVRSLQEKLEEAQRRISELERSCSEQKKRIQEIDALTSGSDGVGIIEARLRKDIDNLKREKTVMLEDIEDYKKRLEEVGSSEAKLTEINAELSHQITQMVNDFDSDKHAALERCQRTMEEVNRISIENLRKEMGERYQSEKSMIDEQYKTQIQALKQQLSTIESELDNVKSLYVKTCEESVAKEAELTDRFNNQLEEELAKMKDQLEEEKKEYERYLRDKYEKEEDGEKDSSKDGREGEMRAEMEKEIELKVSQARLEWLEEQRASRQTVIDEAVCDARKLWAAQHETGSLNWKEERENFEAQLALRGQEIIELKRELDSKMREDPGNVQKHVTDVEAEWKMKLEAMEKQHKEDVNKLMAQFEREKKEIEEKLEDVKRKLSDDGMEKESHDTGKDGGDGKDLMKKGASKNVENSSLGSVGGEDVTVLEGRLREKENEMKDLQMLISMEREKSTSLIVTIKQLEEKMKEKDNEISDLKVKANELEKKEGARLEISSEKETAIEKEAELKLCREKIQDLELKLENAMREISEKNNQAEMNIAEGSAVHDDVMFDDDDDVAEQRTPEAMKKLIKKLKLALKSVKMNYEKQLNEMKLQHKKELDKAARTREEKFQTELRYFLKEREDRGKTKLDKAVKECEAKAKLQLEKALKEKDEKFKQEIEKTIGDYEEKAKQDLEIAVKECERRVRQEIRLTEGKREEQAQIKGSSKEVVGLIEKEKETLQRQVEELERQLSTERSHWERKIKKLDEDKDNEIIVNLSMRHEEEERRLKENFEAELEKIKLEHKKKLDVELEKAKSEHEKNLAYELQKMKSEHEQNLAVELKKAKSEHSETLELKLNKLKEEQEKKLENMRREMERQKPDTTITKNLFDDLEREGEMEKEVAERVKKELEKMKVSVSEEEVNKRVTERMQEERKKWLDDAKDYINGEIKQGVEDRLKEEREKAQKEREMNKEKMEKEKEEEMKERVRTKLETEVANLKKKFISELDARVMKEKSRLEQEVKTWKDDAKKRMDENKEEVMRMLRADMEKKVTEEKKRIERDMKKKKDEEIKDMREEMEREMRKRIQKERREWEEEGNGERRNRISEEDGQNEDIGMKERLQSEMEARTKACCERDKAVEFIKSREGTYREEKQKLIAGLKKCREDLEGMKKEHVALEEKYAEMDRRYKADMKEARRIREQDLTNLRLKLEEEKEALVASFKAKVLDLEEHYELEIKRVKKEGEMEKASLLVEVRKQAGQALTASSDELPDTESSTILELRDQYLETVAKIKADVMSHVQEANVRAATTMKAEIRKQRVKVIEIFKAKAKSSIRSLLSGQVSGTCITALEHSMDTLSEHLISTPTTGSHSASSTPRSNNSNDNRNNDENLPSNNDMDRNSAATKTYSKSPVKQNIDKQSAFERKSGEERRDTENDKGDNDMIDARLRRLSFPEDEYEIVAADNVVTQPQTSGERRQLQPHHHHRDRYHSPLQQQQHQHSPQQPHPHPQLAKVDLFDSDLFHKTPTSSNHSSPAHAGRTKSHTKSTTKPHVTMPDIPTLSLSPNITTRTRSTTSQSKSTPNREENVPSKEASPRDEMKVIEARVRLANWARSGEMPWKSSNDVYDSESPGHSPFASTEEPLLKEINKRGTRRDKSPVSDSDDEYYRKTPQIMRNDNNAGGHGSGSRNVDDDGFVRPDPGAEKLVRMHREKSNSTRPSRNTEKTVLRTQEVLGYDKGGQEMSDDSASSVGSSTSFVTLEPEMTETAKNFTSIGSDSELPKSSQVNSKNYSIYKGDNFYSETNHKGGNSSSQTRGDLHKDNTECKQDYERIRAAFLGDGVHQGSSTHVNANPGGEFDTYGQRYITLPHDGREFESAESVTSEESDEFTVSKNRRVYSKGGSSIPTSTPNIKGTKRDVRSEGNTISSSKHWRTVAGSTFFQSQDHRDPQGNIGSEMGKYGSQFGSNLGVQESRSHHRRHARSRSAERDGGEMVLKSAEFTFPSDISRITHGSNGEQQSLWRYKSLEDLLSKERQDGEREELRDIRLRVDGKKERGRKDGYDEGSGDENYSSQQRKQHKKQVGFVQDHNMRYAPIQAMTSEFWEQQSEEGDGGGRYRYARSDTQQVYEKTAQNIHRNQDGRVESTKREKMGKGDNQHMTRQRKNSPVYLTSGKDHRKSPKLGYSVDEREMDFPRQEEILQPQRGSKSEPRRSRHRMQVHDDYSHDSKSASRNRPGSGKSDSKGDNPGAYYGIDRKHPASKIPISGSSILFMDEVADMRRSLEELKPSQYFSHFTSDRHLSKSKMTRSTSEQSLHTIHRDRNDGQGQGRSEMNSDDNIDALVLAYTSQSQFDLRPFSHDEHF